MNVVLDSNIFLHYKSFEDIPWQTVLGCDDVTILLTATVLEEIDKKKDEGRGKIQRRAKSVSSRIGEILVDGKTGKYHMIFLESAPATEEERINCRLDRKDNQILFDLKKSSMKMDDVIIVSSDIAMLIRAKKQGFKIFKLDDKYLLNEDLSKEEKEANAAIKELDWLKNRMPAPQLVFSKGDNHIQIKRTTCYNIEAIIEERMADLFRKWPEKTINDGKKELLGNTINTLTPEMVLNFNISRKRFFEQSEKKVRLEVIKDDLEKRMKKISIFVSNSGTAATGKMNIFVEIPQYVKLYEKGSKKKIDYETPLTPSFHRFSSRSIINPISGYHKPSVEIWDLEDFMKNNHLKKTIEPLTHNLQHEVFSLHVDSANCPNFKMIWYIADAALPDPVQGELNISFVEDVDNCK